MLVVYESNGEAIVCTKETEEEAVRLYFKEGGRNLEGYDRHEIKEGMLEVTSRVVVWG